MSALEQARVDVVVTEARPTLSVVIPVMDEEGNVDELYRQIDSALSGIPLGAEIIFVDDGSTDSTVRHLREIFHKDDRVQVVELRRNFGKTPALLAGFDVARGDIVVTLDGDLQDDPSELSRFLEKLNEGYDLVSGWKQERHDPWTKTVPSKLFNRVVSKTTGIPLHDFNCGFKAYRREVLEEVKLYSELHRFIPVLAYWRGFRIGEIAVQHHARTSGRSKFGGGRLLKGMLDFLKVLFLTRYMQRPLQLFGLLGAALFAAGLGGFAFLLVLKVEGQSIFHSHGPLLFLSGILIVAGMQLFVLGLLGEMLRNYSFRASDEFSVRARLRHDDL